MLPRCRNLINLVQLQIILSTRVVFVANKIPLADFEKQHKCSDTVTDILEHQLQVQRYDTALLLSLDPRLRCYDSAMLKMPKMELTRRSAPTLSEIFNSRMLAVLCLRIDKATAALQLLATSLQYMRSNRVIVVVVEEAISDAALRFIFTYCLEQQMLNVAVLLSSCSQDVQFYYTSTPFPVLRMQQQGLTNASITFPRQLENLQGYPLLTFPDQLQPRTLLYRSAKGELKMIGYIGRLVSTFAQKLNASLCFSQPVQIGTSVFYTEVIKMVRKGGIDIPASIACINEVDSNAFREQTYSRFIEISRWFPMLPVAAPKPITGIYVLMFYTKLGATFLVLYFSFATLLTIIERFYAAKCVFNSILDLVFNLRALLGMLGQSLDSRPRAIWSSKLVLLLLLASGLLFTTTFDTLLRTNLIQVPTEPELNSFDDLRRRNIKVLESAAGVKLLDHYVDSSCRKKMISVIQTQHNLTEFVLLRNSFNTSVAYSINSALWSVFEKKQLYFARRLFRVSDLVAFANFMVYALPLPDNSIYEQQLNTFISQLHASGIFEYWYHSSFFDMIEVGLMSFKDFSEKTAFMAARAGDFYWIWVLLAMGSMGSSAIFVLEIIYFKLLVHMR